MVPAYQVIKKLKMNFPGLYMLHDLSHSMPQRLQRVIKKQRGMPVTELLKYKTDEQLTFFRNFMQK